MAQFSSRITISISRRIDKTVIDPTEVPEPTNERRQECHELLSNCYARYAGSSESLNSCYKIAASDAMVQLAKNQSRI